MENDITSSDDSFISENALKSFQLSGNTKEKSTEKFGDKIVLECEKLLNSSHFSERNDRFSLNRKLAEGKMDMDKFKDFFNIDGKNDYVNLSWKSIMIVNTIISRLVGRWMTKVEKAKVEAVDIISTNRKKDIVDQAEFLMYNKEMLQGVEETSGVQMIPKDAFIPDDKDELDLWATEEMRLPEEILYEKGINGTFDDCGWGASGINKRKVKHDSATVGLICAEKYADSKGKIHIDYHRPENSFYSYSEYADFRDAAIKGVVVSYSLSEIRSMYPKLTVEELFEIAKSAKEWQSNDKLKYDSKWGSSSFLPFDDWSVPCVRFTLRSLDNDGYEMKVSKAGKLFVDKKNKKPDNTNEYVESKIWRIYRGVYVRDSKELLEWGLEKNMIKPQEYSKISDAYSPFSFYMYQNEGMRNLAIPEKIEEPVEQMILARLKIQQLVAGLRKSGLMYDIDGLQEMDLGNGILTQLELMKVTDQTGNVYFRSKDAEGNRLDNPIRETPNTGGVAQIQALITVYNFHQQVLRDEIGSNEQAEGQTAKPRVGQENVQSSLEVSFNAIDYMNDACVSLMQEIASHVACLLHDAVEFGADEYRDLMKEDAVKQRVFNTKIEMLPDTQELTEFDATINMLMQSNPTLVMYMNPEKIKRIARENLKLADLFLRGGQKRALKGEMQKAQQQSKMNADTQQQAGLAVEKAKQETMQMELQTKTAIEMALSANKQKETLMQGIFGIYQKGIPMPAELQDLAKEIINNVGIPLFLSNQQSQQQYAQQAQQQPQDPNQQQDPSQQQGQPQQDPSQQQQGMQPKQ